MEKAIVYLTTKESVAWYRNIFSEQANSGLIPTFDHIATMKDIAEKNGISFSLVIYPLMTNMKNYPFDDVQKKIRELAEQRGISTIDLLPEFKNHVGEKLTVHPVDYHPNGHAHEIAAIETARLLRK